MKDQYQTLEICMAVVVQDGLELDRERQQTPEIRPVPRMCGEICLAAVGEDGQALK